MQQILQVIVNDDAKVMKLIKLYDMDYYHGKTVSISTPERYGDTKTLSKGDQGQKNTGYLRLSYARRTTRPVQIHVLILDLSVVMSVKHSQGGRLLHCIVWSKIKDSMRQKS
ncbi:hypothetical protein PoB_003367600 [Plakobranchus ocellatus]|uniref:Uncharacterized protein n=1 Tax=Plakobranchus ocellatus TaxID=259542 RepID=A0AAV4AKR2_9GAST|nr:hypothetical protein PoB_003367600 [Plakobranchus ocellatus]